VFEVRGLTKRFPAVCALDEVSLAFAPGEVHGVIGENGAGKSTLMKLLSGVYAPTSGEIRAQGKPIHFRNPGEAIAAGIVMIHQELNLVDELSVADNIFLGRERTRGLTLDRETTRKEAARALQQVSAPFTPEVRVGDLSIAGKQLVEIAKAISYEARLIIMDEPTAVLSERETSALFALIADLRAKGVTVLFVSHILTELVAVCDRITVLRDGRFVATLDAKSTHPAELARLMVGRDLEDVFPVKNPPPSQPPALEVKGLAAAPMVQEFNLEIGPGEIVGLAGLVGSGRTEAAEAIVGLRPRTSGTIRQNGAAVSIRNARDAMRHRIAYVSEDRKGCGLVLPMDTTQNVTLANLRAYAKPVLDAKSERQSAEGWVRKLGIRVGDLSEPVSSLSGGNQQKVAVAKWLETQPEVLILDEPTRGIDIGAKREMYALIHDLAAQGMACLVISSEMPELIGLCHRVLVLREGRVMGELAAEEITEEAIMLLAAAVEEAVAR